VHHIVLAPVAADETDEIGSLRRGVRRGAATGLGTKAQMVYEQLRDWIVRGRLQPGNLSTRNGWPGCST
jgi:hypothetical protein